MKTIANVSLFALCMLFFAHTPTQAQSKELSPFDHIRVTGNIQVFIQEGESESIRLEVSGIPEDDISVKVSRGTLKLKMVKSIFYKNEDVKAYVTYRKLRGMRASAGATIEAQNTMQVDQIEVRAGSGSWILAEVNADMLEGTATEGGVLKLRGNAESEKISVATGGQCDCEKLKTERAYVRANTGGQATVYVTETLEASANTGGGIKYAGNPRSTEIKELMSGGVEKI